MFWLKSKFNLRTKTKINPKYNDQKCIFAKFLHEYIECLELTPKDSKEVGAWHNSCCQHLNNTKWIPVWLTIDNERLY